MDELILCDGCHEHLTASALSLISSKGVQVRYCRECRTTWESFEAACLAQAAVYQRLQDLFERDARTKVQLMVTPLDFPKFWETPEEGLRLG